MRLELVLNNYSVPKKVIISDYASVEELSKGIKAVRYIRRAMIRDMLYEVGKMYDKCIL